MTVEHPDAPVNRCHDAAWRPVEVGDVARGRAEVEALFQLLGEASQWEYPPQERIKSLGSLAAWVWISPTARRWEARRGSTLVGTVQLQLLAEDRATGVINDGLVAYWDTIATEVAAVLGVPVTGDGMAVVERLAVHPAARRGGIGRVLLDLAVSRAHTLGHLPVLVVLAASTPAITLYRRCGGVEIASRRGLSGREVLVFAFPAPSAHAALV